jgi:lipopolysaccharide/colanic/teichoic acid biosynthesis glycosyltransferase
MSPFPRPRPRSLLARLFPGDRLPNVLSQSEFQQAFLRERSLVDRRQRAFSLIVFLPDGHEPRALPRLAKLLRERLRTADQIGRLDDRNLAALLPATDGQGAWSVAEAVLESLARAGLRFDCKVYSYPCDNDPDDPFRAKSDGLAAAEAQTRRNEEQRGSQDGSGGDSSGGGGRRADETVAAGPFSNDDHSGDDGGNSERSTPSGGSQRGRAPAGPVTRGGDGPSPGTQALGAPEGAGMLRDTAVIRRETLAPARPAATFPEEIWPSTNPSAEFTRIRRDSSAQSVEDLRPLFWRPLPWWKRTMDLACAGGAIVVLSPVLLLIALAIKLDSRGPVIFRQRRAGIGGQPFTFYKFRSMHPDAEARRAQLEALNEKDGPIFKIKNDPRITRVGGFLRRYSLDELPQLWNVVKGDMSLVGPRPPTMNELPGYEPWQRRRLELTGGLTCIWQVSGRSDVSFKDWMRMDLRYARKRTLRRDVSLLLKTFGAVFRGRGAY